MTPSTPWRVARVALRTYGARGMVRRAVYEIERRAHLAALRERRAAPPVTWPGFQFPYDLGIAAVRATHAAQGSGEPAEVAANSLLAGEFDLYGGEATTIGFPPDWHRHPLTGHVYPSDVHWSAFSDAGQHGDLKDVWEPARLSFTGAFLRAYAETGDDRWAHAFWATVESWAAANPPYTGVHWMNGQEVAIRAINVMAGLAALRDASATTPARREMAGAFLQNSARRVVRTLGYALSQRNNHAISEAAFLWSAAVLCDGLPGRARLERRGRRALEESIADQFGEDGSYAQHSFTYQRVALHGLLWARWAAVASDRPMPNGLVDAVDASLGLLTSAVEHESGRVPNLGANDGALLFRLSGCGIGDFRPLLAHAAAVVGRASPLPPGPWDEEARWFGLDPHAIDAPPRGRPGTASAYHVLRGPHSHALLRAGPMRHRPSHADQLHLDLWIGGVNVLRDAGSYRYTAPAPWQNALAGAEVHNVPLPAGRTEAGRAGRFFWLEWPAATVLVDHRGSAGDPVVAELDCGGVTTARRCVVRRGDTYVVVDRLSPSGGHVRWNLPLGTVVEPGAAETSITRSGFVGRLDAARELQPIDADPTSGWESLTYGERRPLTAVVVEVSGTHTTAWFAPSLSAAPSAAFVDAAVALCDRPDQAAVIAAVGDASETGAHEVE